MERQAVFASQNSAMDDDLDSLASAALWGAWLPLPLEGHGIQAEAGRHTQSCLQMPLRLKPFLRGALHALRTQVNGRIIVKKIHVRVEHVHPSRCKEDFLRRVKSNDEFKHEAKLRGGA
jgi:hypothetical protein